MSGSEKMTIDQANLIGHVCKMHTAWMQREDMMRMPGGGFEHIEKMANLMDEIVDAVPELERLAFKSVAARSQASSS